MTRPLVGWQQLASLMQGSCTFDGETPGQPPGRTIDPDVEEDNRNDREWQTPGGCNDNME